MTWKLHQLNALIALVDRGSIRGAAQALGITQPALSSRIAELEQEVGATLVNRTAHGTTLTRIGRALFVHARIVDNHVRRAQEELAQLTHKGVASLTIGASPLAAMDIIAPLLVPLQAHDPDVHLTVNEGQFHEMSVALREGALDFVVAPIPLQKQRSKMFRFEELVSYPMRVVARAGHPLGRTRKLAQLAAARWVVGAATSSTRSTLEELYLEYGLPKPAISVHADAGALVLASVAASDLLALLPSPLFETWSQIAALPITDPIRPARLGLITLAGTPLTPIAERFVALIRGRAGQVAKAIASRRGP